MDEESQCSSFRGRMQGLQHQPKMSQLIANLHAALVIVVRGRIQSRMVLVEAAVQSARFGTSVGQALWRLAA